MSWLLTDLAGKAENLLNKIDQNAAVVLKDKSSISDQLTDVIWNTPPIFRDTLPEQSTSNPNPATSVTIDNVSATYVQRHIPSGAASPALRSSPARSDVNFKRTDDDDLLRFLNSSGQTPPVPDDYRSSPSGASLPSPVSYSPVDMVGRASQGSSRSHSRSQSQGGSVSSVTEDPFSQRCFKPVQTVATNNHCEGAIGIPVNNIQAENDLLKNEVRTLNNEMSLLLQRTKAAEREVRVVEQELQKSREEHLTSEADYQQQLQFTKTQLHNAQQELTAIKEDYKMLKDRKTEADKVDSEHLHELDSLKEKLRLASAERVTLQEENREASLEIARLQAAVAEAVSHNERHRQHLASVTSEAEQYRARVTKVLQEKERLIATLQSGEPLQNQEKDSMLELEGEQLRQELQVLRQETTTLTEKLQASRQELQELENRHEEVRQRTEADIQRLQDKVQKERSCRLVAEEDCHSHREELQMVKHELSQQRDTLASRLREKEAELLHIKQQSSQAYVGFQADGSKVELEARVRQLATSLIQKQGTLEALIAERNALRLQLERVEKAKVTETSSGHNQVTNGIVDNDVALRSRVPLLLEENPTDTSVTRRVKRAYSSLDTLGIRVGVFLRRYPLARILVILYVVFMHFWVALVLFSYSSGCSELH